jgi:hypothetical protein
MEDISEVITAIANFYKDSISSPERIQLWNKNATENTLIQDLDEIPDEYYLKPKTGGLFLTIVLLPLPTPSRQATEKSLGSWTKSRVMNWRLRQVASGSQ